MCIKYNVRTLFILYLFTIDVENSDITLISINMQGDVYKVRHFWKSTGFSPLGNLTTLQKYILSDDEKLNLAFIGALPNNAISHVRIHWLINLIRIAFDNSVDYKYLDELIFWLRRQHLYPRFELMGVPINSYEKLHFNKSFTFWNDITNKIITRYGTYFGRKEISKWKFETWNEPDLHGYNILNFTLIEYLDYVQAISKAIQNYNSKYQTKLTLGGPAGLFKQESNHPLCWGLLKYCNNLVQTSINKSNCPIDYITFHKKGNRSANEILREDLQLLEVFHEKFPSLRNMSIANDEADILANWSKDENWRGDVRYAAMIAKVIIDHYKEIIVKLRQPIEVLSNDNAFINYHPFYFTQRTLLTRFQINNTRPPHIQFVQKPSYAVMGLLSLLGDRYLPIDDTLLVAEATRTATTPGVTINSSSSSSIRPGSQQPIGKIRGYSDLVTVLATRDGNGNVRSNSLCHVATIVTFSNDITEDLNIKLNLRLSYINLPVDDCFYVVYILDNQKTNPYKIWQAAGNPVFPNVTIRNQMRSVQEPYRIKPPQNFSNSSITIKLQLTLPTVALINICCLCSSVPPGRVTELQIFNVTKNEVLLIWKDNKVNNKCLRTFEVEYQSGCDLSQFKLLHRPDSIYLSYQHHYDPSPHPSATMCNPQSYRNSFNADDAYVTPQERNGLKKQKKFKTRYRVRAVDYWSRAGLYSNIVTIN